ncbi:MAG: MATE family efflux transporter [Candidatus Heteroscillospira sp.]
MSLLRKFFKFVIPSIAAMWVFSLYTMVDGMFVSHGVGEHALAAVNLSLPYVNLIFAVGLMFAVGASTLISISLGMGRREEACRCFNQNLSVVSAVCLLMSAATLLFLDPIARLLGGGENTLDYVKQYVGTIAPFAVFFAVSYNLEVQVKADGAPFVSTIGVCACALMNVVLDYIFVMHFHWGVWGAALATGLAQVCSTVIFALYFIYRGNRLKFGCFKPKLSLYRRIIPLGLSEGLTELSNGLVIFAFNLAIIRVLGEDKVTSYTVISYVNTLVLMTMSGISQGIQPLVSYHFGAGETVVCRRVLGFGLTAVASFAAVLFALSELFAPAIVGLFLERESGLFDYTVQALRLFGVSFLPVGFNVVMSGYFTAVEKPGCAFPISVGRSLVLLLASLWFTAAILGGEALWTASAISEFLCLLLTAFFVCRSKRRGEL